MHGKIKSQRNKMPESGARKAGFTTNHCRGGCNAEPA
jgi:hypothetical protein